MPRPRSMRRPTPATLIALLALFIAVGGPAQAARLIDGGDIRKESVAGSKIKKLTLTGRHIKRSSVLGNRLRDGTLHLTKLNFPSLVALTTTPFGEVNSAKVADKSLTSADIGDEQLGQGQIAKDGVGATEIADGSIDSGEIVDGRQLARDISSFAGTFDHEFGTFTGVECKFFEVEPAEVNPRPAGPKANLTDDVLVVTPPTGFPDLDFVLTAKAVTPTKLHLTACHLGANNASLGLMNYRYLAIDF